MKTQECKIQDTICLAMRPKTMRCSALCFALVILHSALIATAAQVQLSLVVHDRPDTTVDKEERQRPITNPVSTDRGVVMQKVGLDLVCWARNIRLDGQPIFERYYEGKYIDRLPVAKPDLKAGKHTIWPGDHVFSVADDGKLTTDDPELLIDGNAIRIKCYPVIVRAFRANPDEADLPMSMRIASLPNLTLRESGDAEKNAPANPEAAGKALDLLPVFDDFAPLTIWLPANTVGKGYLVHPVGLTFHLDAKGVQAGAGGGQSVQGLRVEQSLIEIPLYGFSVVGEAGTTAIVPGVEKFDGTGKLTNWYPRHQPYEFKVSEAGAFITIDGDLKKLPFKSLRVDIDPVSRTQRALAVEIESRHLTPGVMLNGRIQAVDTGPATLARRAADEAVSKLAGATKAEQTARAELAKAESAVKAATGKIQALDAAKAKLPVANKVPSETAAQPDAAAAAEAVKAMEADIEAATKSAEAAKTELAEANQALATAQAVATASTNALIPAQADVQTRQAAADAVVGVNPLASATPFGQVQPYGAATWTDLQVQRDQNAVRITVPAMVDGVYRLRLGVRPSDAAAEPIYTEQWVSVAAEGARGVGLFTQRGRDAFFRGESFWIGLGVLTNKQPLAAGTALEVDLVDARGTRLPLLRQQTSRALDAGGRDTFVARLDANASLSLAPGRYKVQAKAGSATARELTIEIVDPEPATHFTNLLNGKYNALGAGKNSAAYSSVIRSGEGAEELAREIVAMGYNAFMGMSYDLDRVSRHGLDLEQLVRERPALGPWESYYQPSGRDRFMNAAVRNRLRFYENLFTYNDTMLPREPRILDACDRYTSLEVASIRHNPALQGVCLYDEFYSSTDNNTPQAVVAAFYKSQEMLYREKYPGLSSADAGKALDRFVGRPAGQRNYADLEKFRTWPAYQDYGWRYFSDRMSTAAKSVMPESQNYAQQRFWGQNGGNLGPNGLSEDVFASLDVATCVMYKDGGSGDRPVFAPMQADVLRIRDGLPVWTQLHNYHASGLFGAHLLRQAFFGLSQKIEGFSFFTIEHDFTAPSPTDNRDTVRDIAGQLCTPYGDLFVAMNRGYKKVAVYYSRQAAYLQGRKPNDLEMSCEGLWVACMRAGFPADFLTDQQINEGKGMDYQVIFVPGIQYEDELPPQTKAALQKLSDAGKILAVERSSKLPIERIVRLDSELDEYDGKLGGPFPRYVDFETEMVFDQTEQMTLLVREFLGKHIPPAAQHNLLVGPDWLKCGQGEYMFIPNFAPTKFKGLYKTLYQAPDRPTLRFPRRPPFCYDVLEMKPIPVATEGEWMSLQADMRHYPGKIYAFLPAAIDRVRLRANSAVQGGSDLNYQVSVADAKGRDIDAGFAIQITLLNPAGTVLHEVYRAAAPVHAGTYRVPVNPAVGTWKLRVRELISGAVAESSFAVESGTLPPAKLDERPVWVHDGQKLRMFLDAKEPVAIAIDQEQPWVRSEAQRLVKLLGDRGREAKIVAVADVVRLPGDWDRAMPTLDGARLWRGDLVNPGLFVDSPLILLGKRYENRLIEALVRRDVLPEPITAAFPAPGKAMVGWTRKAFSNQFDTLTVLANDEAGLARGIDALLAKDPTLDNVPVHPPLAKAQADPNAKLTDAKAQSHALSSFGDALSGEDRIVSLDYDPATGRTLAGTFGYGDNLFCLGADGKLLWKVYLPEHSVFYARWYDDGKRVVAATGRGYHVFLINAQDGKILNKFASTEWPNGHGYKGFWEGSEETTVPIIINPKLRQILVGGQSGLMAVDYDGKKMWYFDRALAVAAYAKEAEQTEAAAFGKSAVTGNFALSPDGTKVAYSEEIVAGSTEVNREIMEMWRYVPRVLDARTGKVLLENNQDPGNRTGAGSWYVTWPRDSADPWVNSQGVRTPLQADGKLGTFMLRPGDTLRAGGMLVADRLDLRRLDARGATLWHSGGQRIWLSSLDKLSADELRFYRCDRDGLVRCIDMQSGNTIWDYKLPFNAVLTPTPDGLVAGANNGAIVRLDAAGRATWSTRLRDLHELPEANYAQYVRAGERRDPDSSAELLPVGQDAPDDYASVLRMGIEQLVNGDCRTDEVWSIEGGRVTFAPGPDKAQSAGTRSLQLGSATVTQRVQRRIIPASTYLLEFFYQVDGDQARVIAGGMLGSEGKPSLMASKFSARPGEWVFGRLAIKTLPNTTTLDIGFEAEGGAARVANISLRPIRFPSPNLLANAELQAMEPTFVRDIRVQYDRIVPSLREKLMNRNRVAAFRQGQANTAVIWSQEQAYLHNGRLDDVGESWCYQPDNMGFSVALTKPSYISHLVLYLNNAAPDNVYGTMSILANDLKTKLPYLAHLVRGNSRRFVVVYFPQPIYTDLLKILPGYHGAHHECMTEIEVYGPLGGPETAGKPKALPSEENAVAMFMGDPSHAPTTLPSDATGEYVEVSPGNVAPAFLAGSTVVDGLFTVADANGLIRSFAVSDEGKGRPKRATHPTWPLATVTPLGTPARYAGRMLVSSADGKLHAIADDGLPQWTFQTAGRIYSSPLPSGDDVYVGSDDGRLYKLDVDSGTLIWEFPTADKIRAAPAMDKGRVVVPSWDGFLYCVDANSGLLIWKSPIAKYTSSSPAIRAGRVYVGDEQGHMLCFDAATGKEMWRADLGGFISTCPVVTPDGVLYVSETGKAAMLGTDGSVKWKRAMNTRITGQPMATHTQLLVPTQTGLLVLRGADGQPDPRFIPPTLGRLGGRGKASTVSPGRVISVLKYKDALCMTAGNIAIEQTSESQRTFVRYDGPVIIWSPKPPAGGEK